jgi:hypothetical protein
VIKHFTTIGCSFVSASTRMLRKPAFCIRPVQSAGALDVHFAIARQFR